MARYPAGHAARDQFVLDRRPARARHDPWHAQGLLVEDELAEDGTRARVATLFLTGRECPWRCVMCDLWQHTTESDTPPGAIAAQVAAARASLHESREPVSHLKLYNAGSFFDPRAVPERDYDAIAVHLVGLTRVIVESHPSLVGARTSAFIAALGRDPAPPALEVAMGLETVHAEALERLHKRMTVESFQRAADGLRGLGAALRVFLLVSPPFIAPTDQDEWLLRSVDVAFAAGATAVSLIPTRTGNGALDSLAEDGCFRGPRLFDLERSLALAQAAPRPTGQRVFADLWDLQRFADCRHCLDARRTRLVAMNMTQCYQPAVHCPLCPGSPPTIPNA